MFGFLASLLGGPLVNAVMGVVNKVIDKQITEVEARAEIEKAILSTIATVSQHQADVIMTETKAEDWLTRNWRPIVALTSFFSVWFVIFMFPFAVQVFPSWSVIRFGDVGLEWFYTLTTICVSGYVGGRTLEKIATTMTRRR